jgi:hypothetical protein
VALPGAAYEAVRKKSSKKKLADQYFQKARDCQISLHHVDTTSYDYERIRDAEDHYIRVALNLLNSD